jgi:hypothetical protein
MFSTKIYTEISLISSQTAKYLYSSYNIPVTYEEDCPYIVILEIDIKTKEYRFLSKKENNGNYLRYTLKQIKFLLETPNIEVCSSIEALADIFFKYDNKLYSFNSYDIQRQRMSNKLLHYRDRAKPLWNLFNEGEYYLFDFVLSPETIENLVLDNRTKLINEKYSLSQQYKSIAIPDYIVSQKQYDFVIDLYNKNGWIIQYIDIMNNSENCYISSNFLDKYCLVKGTDKIIKIK